MAKIKEHYIKVYVPEELYVSFNDYCRLHCYSMSALAKKLIIAELSRRGFIRKQEGTLWVRVPDDQLNRFACREVVAGKNLGGK